MAQEAAGQTLQATALVHEAYLRLVDVGKAKHWDSQGHFFAAWPGSTAIVYSPSARGRSSHPMFLWLHDVVVLCNEEARP